MTKRRVKQLAWIKAASWLQALLGAGYPYEMVVGDAAEFEDDLTRLHAAMTDIVGFCESRGPRP